MLPNSVAYRKGFMTRRHSSGASEMSTTQVHPRQLPYHPYPYAVDPGVHDEYAHQASGVGNGDQTMPLLHEQHAPSFSGSYPFVAVDQERRWSVAAMGHNQNGGEVEPASNWAMVG